MYNQNSKHIGSKVLSRLSIIFPEGNPIKWAKKEDSELIINEWGKAIANNAREDIVHRALNEVAENHKTCPKSPAEFISICKKIIDTDYKKLLNSHIPDDKVKDMYGRLYLKCEHLEGGLRCGTAGTISHDLGSTAKWYCNKHFWQY